jgi:uncharacterized protein YlxP (DUF503 family)
VPAIGVLQIEIHIPHARSIKDRRNIVRRFKSKMRTKHNVAVAEVDDQMLMNRASVCVVTVSSSKDFAEKVLEAVERDAEALLGDMFESAVVDFV